MRRCLQRPLDTLIDGSSLGAELKLLTRIPVLLRQVNGNLLLGVWSSPSDDGTCCRARLIGPHIADEHGHIQNSWLFVQLRQLCPKPLARLPFGTTAFARH